jgi:hypothetical protein
MHGVMTLNASLPPPASSDRDCIILPRERGTPGIASFHAADEHDYMSESPATAFNPLRYTP